MLVEDLALVDATLTALAASGTTGPQGPMGPPGYVVETDSTSSDSGFWPIVDQRPRVTQAQVLARVYLGT